MRKRSRAALAPVVIAMAAIAGAAGYRAQESGPGRRLDELSKGRPAAASHFPVDGALAAASQAAAESEALEAQRASHAQHLPVPVVGVGAAAAPRTRPA